MVVSFFTQPKMHSNHKIFNLEDKNEEKLHHTIFENIIKTSPCIIILICMYVQPTRKLGLLKIGLESVIHRVSLFKTKFLKDWHAKKNTYSGKFQNMKI